MLLLFFTLPFFTFPVIFIYLLSIGIPDLDLDLDPLEKSAQLHYKTIADLSRTAAWRRLGDKVISIIMLRWGGLGAGRWEASAVDKLGGDKLNGR